MAKAPALPVHATMADIKAKAIPKQVDAAALPTLSWKGGDALNEQELKVLVTLLRDEGPNTEPGEPLKQIAAALDGKQATAFSKALLEQWEKQGSPAAHKWMLFQMRALADRKTLLALGKRFDWLQMASNNQWARANWYLELTAAQGEAPENCKLFYDLLSKGGISGTVVNLARTNMVTFAHQAKLSMDDYLEREGLIGLHPSAPLPFSPGEVTVGEGEERYSVGLELGQLVFTDEKSKHKLRTPPESLSKKEIEKLEKWQHAIDQEALRWGAYFHRLMSYKKPLTLKEIHEDLFAHPLSRSLAVSLVWRDDKGHLMRIEEDGAFDVEYEAVELPAQATLSLCSVSELPQKERDAWNAHLAEEEIVLPYNLLERDLYQRRLERLLEAEDQTSEDDDSVSIGIRLWDENYDRTSAEAGSWTFHSYRSYPEYNTRVFIEHTGLDVADVGGEEWPGSLKGVKFEDMFGNGIPQDRVYVAVLVEVCQQLARIKRLEGGEHDALVY